MTYEPGSIECRIFIDCKENIMTIQQLLDSIEDTTGSIKNICNDLTGIYKELDHMHECISTEKL